MIQTIQQQWKDVEEKILPEHAGENQRREMRRAFFIGFAACLATVAEAADLPTEEEGAAVLEDLHAQSIQFAADVKSRRA